MLARKWFPRGAVAAALILLVVACGTADAGSDDADAGSDAVAGDQIVVTTTVLGDVVDQLVAGEADVEVLLPVGADTHGFALNASQARTIRDADLVVANGLDLEEGMVDALAAAERDGTPLFRATDHVETIPLDADHAPDEDQDEDHGPTDPHFWFDPSRMADVVIALGDRLDELGIGTDADWTARATAFAEELRDLDRDVADTLSVVPAERRQIVTNHEALGYFADRYDLEIVGTVLPGGTSLAEPSAAALEALVATITETGTTAIFAETTASTQLAETVAAEVGGDVAVVELFTESLSAPDGPAATYQDFMRTNATRVADALA